MIRIPALSLLVASSLLLGGCGKKKSQKSKPAPKPTTMAAMPPASPTPMTRPRVAARPMAQPTPSTPAVPAPPEVTLTGETETLAKVVETALRSGKPDAVIALVPTAATIAGCPQLKKAAVKRWGSLEKAFAHTRKQVKTAFTSCTALGDWTDVKRTGARQQKQPLQPVDGCKRLIQHGHLYLAYVVGGKTVTLKLADPARVDGKSWVLLDGLRCRLSGNRYR